MDTKRDQDQAQDRRLSDAEMFFLFGERKGDPGRVLRESSEERRAKPEAEADGDGA